ncbi:MAG TPA: outer membrane protein transport protein [Desulfuromonadaceae bacterium]|nr:outer membrane protein transport protein [Desulfuromonadaceae bacterium]
MNKKTTWTGVILFSATVLVFCAISAQAVGFRLPNQDPEGIARGNAFAATADNPSAIYYNPAGITQVEGEQLRVGLYVISADTTYSSPGGKAETDATPQMVPQIYFAAPLTNTPLYFGFGVYAPYGLSLDWGKNTPFNTVAESGSLLYASFNPVVAWRVAKSLSIAWGPTVNYSEARFYQAISSSADQFWFKGKGIGVGYTAGLLWQPHPQWSFGVNYRSATSIDYRGSSQAYPYFAEQSTHASVDFPQYIVGGISFRPTPVWNLEFDLDWTEWKKVRQIVFKNTSFGNVPVVLNYQNSLMYEFGITRQLGNGYFASVGYIYSENSSPDTHFTPLIPDANLHLGSVGIGHRGDRWDWAAAYHFAYGERTVQGDANASANGHYKTFNNAFNLAGTLKF